jgi:hypothetical protein
MKESRRTACVVIPFLVWAVIGATERFPPLSARFNNNKNFNVLIKLIVINILFKLGFSLKYDLINS